MKLSELKPCAVCHGKIVPTWYVVRISQAILKPNAANETLGLMQMFGGSLALAEAMSSHSDCVAVFGDEDKNLMTEVNVCQNCFLMKPLNMAMLIEATKERENVET